MMDEIKDMPSALRALQRQASDAMHLREENALLRQEHARLRAQVARLMAQGGAPQEPAAWRARVALFLRDGQWRK